MVERIAKVRCMALCLTSGLVHVTMQSPFSSLDFFLRPTDGYDATSHSTGRVSTPDAGCMQQVHSQYRRRLGATRQVRARLSRATGVVTWLNLRAVRRM